MPSRGQLSYVPYAKTENQASVARGLDSAAGDPREKELLDFLNATPVDDLPGPFDLIAPEELGAMYDVTFTASDTHLQNLVRRLRVVRGSLASTSYPAAVVADAGGRSVAAAPVEEDRWNFYVTSSFRRLIARSAILTGQVSSVPTLSRRAQSSVRNNPRNANPAPGPM